MIAYQLLTEVTPFPGKNPRELFQQLLTQDPIPLNQADRSVKFSSRLEEVVMKGLARDLSQALEDGDGLHAGVLRGGHRRAGEEGFLLVTVQARLTQWLAIAPH